VFGMVDVVGVCLVLGLMWGVWICGERGWEGEVERGSENERWEGKVRRGYLG